MKDLKKLQDDDYRSRGRRHEEIVDVADREGRTCFQKDRDRIIHCRAFRRLKDKTQVFVTHHDDHARNRLSHTIEVAQIARDMARMLDLNEDLAEAIALAHDLGHTPFGHAGETALDECLKGHVGVNGQPLHFEHNEQSQRIVEELEHVYPDFPGLNLSIEVLEGLMKHKTSWDSPEGDDGEAGEEIRPSMEAQVVNLADEIAYQNHDVDDGLRAGLFGESDMDGLLLWQMASEAARKKYGEIEDGKIRIARTVSKMIGLMIHDVFEETKKRLGKCKHGGQTVRFSPEMARANLELKDFLAKRLYFSDEVLKHSRKGQRIIKALFGHYEKELGAAGARDFIAGMTDRFAQEKAEELQLEF